jgi:transposase InsO family protein
MSRVVTLTVGVSVFYNGDACEVVALDGSGVTLKNGRTGHFSKVSLARLAGTAQLAGSVEDGERASTVVALFGLTPAQRKRLSERAGHLREMLTGYRSGHSAVTAAREPRPQFNPSLPLAPRYQAKADELGVDVRTVRRWVASYQEAGEAGLVDTRVVRGRGSAVDKRWEEALRQVLAEGVAASTPTRGALLYRAARLLEQTHGVGVVPVPSTATAYRRLAEMTKGTNAVAGSAKGRRSIADRPTGVFGRLRPTRPGEYVVLDTQDLDVFAMEPVTCRWVSAQLTVAQDLYTRAILGLRVTPVSTKTVDVAGVLYQAIAPPVDAVPDEGSVTAEDPPVFPYHGVPNHLVFSEGEEAGAVVVCPPETLVVDHGKVFLSAHVISVCAQLGISIQPAQPYKPTDKPTVERFFRSLREGLIQHLPAYKGPDVHSRGEGVEEEAFLYLHELEDVIREWVGVVYHRRKHRGLVVPEWPGLSLSPVEMHGLGVARAGMLRLPARPELVYEFLEVLPRTIQNYGVEAFGLKYNGEALDGRRNQVSPYGGAYGGNGRSG